MKVVCDACQAKYQIPDERIAGRKLKIRCRKCGEAILIQGEHLAAGASTPGNGEVATHAADEWHVSVDGEQYGPYPQAQAAEMLRDSQLPWEAHVWREGYGEWKLASDSDTLVRAVARNVRLGSPAHSSTLGASMPQAEDEIPTRMTPSSGILGEAVLDANESPARAAQPTYRARTETPTMGFAPQQGTAGSPRVSASMAMTGERNENSVLFSVHNLTAIASASASQARPGQASGEGSGLIDIRALAALARTNASSPARATTSATARAAQTSAAAEDGLLRLASQAGAFGSLDSLSPMTTPRRASSNALPIAIVAGSAMIAAGGFLAVYMTRGQAATVSPAAISAVAQPVLRAPEVPPAMPAPSAAPSAPAKAPPQKPETPALTAVAAKSMKTSEPPRPANRAAAAGSVPARSGKPSGKSAASAASAKSEASSTADEPKREDSTPKPASIDDLLVADKKPAPAADAPKPAAPSKPRSIDDLLDTAVDGDAKKSAKASTAVASPDPSLPQTPTRDQVIAAMHSIEADVRTCAQGGTLEAPSAKVSIIVTGATGRVSSARVTGIQGPIGSCIARVVRGANFAKFNKPQFSFDFPFKLK